MPHIPSTHIFKMAAKTAKTDREQMKKAILTMSFGKHCAHILIKLSPLVLTNTNVGLYCVFDRFVLLHISPIFTQETHTLCVFDRLPVVSWRQAKYKQMYGLKSTLTVSR